MNFLNCSVGTDIIEIERIKKSIKSVGFIKRVFSQEEIDLFKLKNYSPQTIAANFCGKEAFSKALGSGVIGFALSDVSILRNKSGKPYIKLSNNAQEIAKSKNLEFDISLSHTKEYAVAVVIAQRRNGA